MTAEERRRYHKGFVKELRGFRGKRVALILNGGRETIKGVVSFSGEELLLNGKPVIDQISFFNVIS